MQQKILLFILLLTPLYVNAQNFTCLEKNLKIINLSLNLPNQWEVLSNEIGIVFDELMLNQDFGSVHAIFKSPDNECAMALYIGSSSYKMKQHSEQISGELGSIRSYLYNRIKFDLKHGKRLKSASDKEIEEINEIIKFHSVKQAQEYCNADIMISYPKNMRVSYQDRFNICESLIFSKDGRDIYLYFMLTDKGYQNREEYFNQIKKVFWYNN